MQIFGFGYYDGYEIVMELYRKMSYRLSASSHCMTQMFICKFIILFYDNGAQKI